MKSFKWNWKKVITLFVFAAVSSATVQASTTGSLTLTGVVPAATAITVTGSSGYNSLDLSTTATDLTVATVREINNTTNGYTVSLTSLNGGSLKNGTIGTVGYTAKYNGTSVTLSNTPVTVTNASPSNTVVNVTKSLQISYTGAAFANLVQGSYTDSLTFTIAAN